jgi:hypothetical protein
MASVIVNLVGGFLILLIVWWFWLYKAPVKKK